MTGSRVKLAGGIAAVVSILFAGSLFSHDRDSPRWTSAATMPKGSDARVLGSRVADVRATTPSVSDSLCPALPSNLDAVARCASAADDGAPSRPILARSGAVGAAAASTAPADPEDPTPLDEPQTTGSLPRGPETAAPKPSTTGARPSRDDDTQRTGKARKAVAASVRERVRSDLCGPGGCAAARPAEPAPAHVTPVQFQIADRGGSR